MSVLVNATDFSDLKLVNRGKVRDIYDLGQHLMIVTSDRISAFDVIMDQPIPRKGIVLTQISKFWFDLMGDLVPNHLISSDVAEFPAEVQKYADVLEGRTMLVKKAEPLPVECIVRGYLSGSGWKEYQKEGSVCGIELPAGLVESDKLPQPIFTPSTKAELGDHDENIPYSKMVEMLGQELSDKVRDISIAIYCKARDLAAEKGIIIADTKFEFGLIDDQLIWIDEALTPDSSRFWPADSYAPGGAQPSFDKQFLRDYLETLDWGKTAPAPPLPPEIVAKTSEKYQEALLRLAGLKLS